MDRLHFSRIGIKISAFVLALVVWLYFFAAREGISFTMGRTRRLSVPVEVLESPSSMVDVRVTPNDVVLKVRGTRGHIKDLGPEDLKVFVDIKGLRGGSYALPVRVYSSRPIKIISREPETVTATITIIDSTGLLRSP